MDSRKEEGYFMHSCRKALTSYFARVLSMQDIIGDMSKVDTSQELGADLLLSPIPFSLLTTFVAWLNGGVTLEAFVASGDLTFSWQRAQVALTSAVDWTSTQRAEVRPWPFGAHLCCCSATAGNLGHGVLLRTQSRIALIEERLISVYDCVC